MDFIAVEVSGTWRLRLLLDVKLELFRGFLLAWAIYDIQPDFVRRFRLF